MRIINRLAIASSLLIGLAACGGAGNSSGGTDVVGGGAGARTALINTQIEGCVSSAQQAGRVPAGVDLRAVCGCAINRITEGKSDGEVQAIFARAPTQDEIGVTRTCMMDAMQAATKK